jgi:hypothetical protein
MGAPWSNGPWHARLTSQTGVSERPAHKIIPVQPMEYLTHECDTFIMRHMFDIKNYVLNIKDI